VWCKLGWIGDWGAGATPAKGNPEFYNNGTIPWLRTGELNNGYVYDSEIRITEKALEKCSLRMCKKGDVLIAMYGATIGKVAIAGIELTTNQACCACTPFLIDNKFLLYYLLASKKTFIELGEGGAQPNISREKIIGFPFALPPLAEQHRIVAKIEELMPLVEKYGAAQDALDEWNQALPEKLKKSILQEAIQGKLVPQDPADEPASALLERIREEKQQLVKEGKLKKKDLEVKPIEEDEIPFEIPESWEWVRWGELGEYKKGPFGSSLTKSMFVPKTDEAVKVYEQKNAIQKDYTLGEYYISKEKYETMTGFTVRPGDIIVSCAGTIGETYLLPPEAPFGIINQALMRAKLHLDSIIPYWLLYFQYILLIENKLKGSGSAIKNIPPFEVLKAMPVPLPPLAEQRRIVAKIEELFGVINKTERKNNGIE
jgi:type I restriction enzyme S subunit